MEERLYGETSAEILHRMCKGVHDVRRCEECERYDGGSCKNKVMYEMAGGQPNDSSQPD